MLQLNRPVVVIDLETTGTNPQSDRIVELAAIKIDPIQPEEIRKFRLNPGILISPEAIKVHGITDEAVKNEKKFIDVADDLFNFLSNCDFVGYNIRRYDLIMLEEEFRRVGKQFVWANKGILDTYLTWAKMEPRTLERAVKVFLGKDLVGGHGAEADARASWDVLQEMVKRWDLPTDVNALGVWLNPSHPDDFDTQGKLRWQGQDLVIMFGKYKGRTLRDLQVTEQGFLNWILRKDFSVEIKEVVQRVLMGQHPTRV